MKKNILIVCIVIITLIDVFILIYIKKKNVDCEEKINSSIESIESIVYNNTLIAYQNQNEIIDNVLLANNKDTCYINDLLKDKPLFVFVLPTHACQTCVDFCSNSIGQYLTKELIAGKVIILEIGKRNDYFNAPNLVAKNNYSIQGKLNIPLEKNNIPFFFMLDNDLKAEMLFVPDKRLPRQTEAYFKALEKYIK